MVLTPSIALPAQPGTSTEAAVGEEKLPDPGEQLRWTSDEKIVAHRNMDRLFPSKAMRHAAVLRPLLKGRPITPRYSYGGAKYDLDDYFSRSNATGLLVLQDGRVVLERYAHGNDATTRWASRSMAKSFTSTLVGMALHDGDIKSLDDNVAAYVPELADTRYGEVPIRALLHMSSGIPFTEGAGGDAEELQACTVRREDGCFLALLRKLGTRAATFSPPGTVWNYSSADTLLLALIVERATGQDTAAYLEQRIWQPAGMEADGFWNAESRGGTVMGASGIGATLRDYGRFGQFILDTGPTGGARGNLPEAWWSDALAPFGPASAAGRQYGYQWWLDLPSQGAAGDLSLAAVPGAREMFFARGSGGQVIAINPVTRTVIVKWAVWGDTSARAPRRDPQAEDAALFAAIIVAATERGSDRGPPVGARIGTAGLFVRSFAVDALRVAGPHQGE